MLAFGNYLGRDHSSQFLNGNCIYDRIYLACKLFFLALITFAAMS